MDFQRNFQTQPQNQKNIQEILGKYTDIIRQNHYWIIGGTIVITIIWIIIFTVFLQTSNYASSATIKFDELRRPSVGAVTDFAEIGSEGKKAILRTNSFLTNVIDSLHLRIVLDTPGINHFDLFKNVKFSKDAKYGEYQIINDDSKIRVLFTSTEYDIDEQEIKTVDLGLSDNLSINFNGIDLVLDASILRIHKNITFEHIPRLIALDRIRQKLEGELDRSKTLLTITYTSSTPEASARITNTIADLYIDQLLQHKRYRTSSVLSSLEEQLLAAREALNKSEETLRKFREKNPYLLLSDVGRTLVSGVSNNQNRLTETTSKINRINNLLQQKSDMDLDRSSLAYLELISLWEAENAASGRVMTNQYSTLLDQRTKLLAESYSKDHPRIIDLEKSIRDMQAEIDIRITKFLSELQTSERAYRSNIFVNRRNLKKLPEGELQLAELKQDQEIKAELYSNILVRYNEAKISDASIISDAFIIDRAEIPIVENNTILFILALLVGPIAGFLLSFGTFIVIDFINNTVRDASEVETKFKIPVLATIPIILNTDDIPDDLPLDRRMDAKLITSDYAPSIAGEKFRLLRTRLLLDAERSQRPIIVSSINPGDGKSLVSSNLSITYAQQKMPTVLIDADLRRGVLHNSFGLSKKPGLADLLVSNSKITAPALSKIIQNTHIPNLFLIPSGIQIPNPSELLGGERMRQVIEKLQDNYQKIILDTPPLSFIPDALVLNSFVHNILFVVRYGRTNLNELDTKLSELANTRNDILGLIINASISTNDRTKYSYSYYHY